MVKEKEVTTVGILHLLIVYLVWGSTYLAIRVGVRNGSGFAPFTFGAMRVITAGVFLLLWGKFRGGKWKLSWGDLLMLAGSGLLLWVGGNGLVVWAEQEIESGITALILATVPIWVSLIEAILDRRPASPRMILALSVGFLGIVVLSVPLLNSGIQANIGYTGAIILASLFWSCGMVLQSRRPTARNLQISSGYQQLFGGAGFLILALLFKEPLPQPSPQAWLAFGYLVVFGSLLAFTSFITVLQLLPTKIVITYAYVNPVIAVFLGWIILGEQITWWTVGGAFLVLLGVAGVFRERVRSQRKTQDKNRTVVPS